MEQVRDGGSRQRRVKGDGDIGYLTLRHWGEFWGVELTQEEGHQRKREMEKTGGRLVG